MGVKKYPLIDLFTGKPPPEEVIQALVDLLKQAAITGTADLMLPIFSEEGGDHASWLFLPPGQILTARSTDDCRENEISFKQPVLSQVRIVDKDTTELRLKAWEFTDCLGRGTFGAVCPLQENSLLIRAGQSPQWKMTSATSDKVIKIFSRPTVATKYSPTSVSCDNLRPLVRGSKTLETTQLSRVGYLGAENLYVKMLPKGLLNRKHPGPAGNVYDHFLDYGAVVMKRFHGITLRDHLEKKTSFWELVDQLRLCLNIAKAYEKQISRARVNYRGGEVPINLVDINLQNILVLENGKIVFIDFGSAAPSQKLVVSGYSPQTVPCELLRLIKLCRREGERRQRPHTVGDVASSFAVGTLDSSVPEPLPTPSDSNSNLCGTQSQGSSTSCGCFDTAFYNQSTGDNVGHGKRGSHTPNLYDSDPDADSDVDFDDEVPKGFDHVDIYALGRIFLSILNEWRNSSTAEPREYSPSVEDHYWNRERYETYHLKHNQVSIKLNFRGKIQAILDRMFCYVAEERCPIQWVIERLEALIREMERGNRPQNTYSLFRPDPPPPPTDNRGLTGNFSLERAQSNLTS